MVGHHPTNKLIGREPIPHQNTKVNLSQPTHAGRPEYPVLATLSCGYPEEEGRLLTCYSPVRHSTNPQKRAGPFDLHVLSTPPAFVLSQDQTLQTKPNNPHTQQNHQTHGSPTTRRNHYSKTVPQREPSPSPTHQNKAGKTKTKHQAHNTRPPTTTPEQPRTTAKNPAPQTQQKGTKNMTHYRDLKQHTHPGSREPDGPGRPGRRPH